MLGDRVVGYIGHISIYRNCTCIKWEVYVDTQKKNNSLRVPPYVPSKVNSTKESQATTWKVLY